MIRNKALRWVTAVLLWPFFKHLYQSPQRNKK